MTKKVWSGLLIGMALGIFITGSLLTFFMQEGPEKKRTGGEEAGEAAGFEEPAPSKEENGQEQAFPVVVMEIEKNHSLEELVYDLMVEGVITSKAQQQEIYEVLTYRGVEPGIREIPLYASTGEILQAMEGP